MKNVKKKVVRESCENHTSYKGNAYGDWVSRGRAREMEERQENTYRILISVNSRKYIRWYIKIISSMKESVTGMKT